MSTTLLPPSRPSEAWFVTTHWTVVLAARDMGTPQSAEALETLCRTYWYPLYAYVRRQGHVPHDAQDLTQEFFARLLLKGWLEPVALGKGKFRTFLLVVLKRFLADEWDRTQAAKRGGGQIAFSLDAATAEERYRLEPVSGLSAEKIYERRWALTLLEQTMARLEREFVAAGKAGEFDKLKAFLTAAKGEISYSDTAAALDQSEATTRQAVHRLRRRFRQLFREEIAHTVSSPDEIDDEVRHLMGLFAE
jgi:DNA-directed RNA polymerase specialized sigma24 family protein